MESCPRPALAACLALLAAIPGTGRTASAQDVEQVARVIATDGVGGRFAHPVCSRRRTLEPVLGADFTYPLERAARDPDQPLIVDLGGLLTPNGVTRYSALNDPDALADLVAGLGYRALAYGLAELAAPRAAMVGVAAALRARRIPMIASNLRCEEEAEAVCAAIVDASDGISLHVASDRRIAVTAVVRKNALSMVAPDRAAGILVEDPIEALERDVRLARERAADLVIAIVDAGIAEDGILALAARLPEARRPDLILAAGAGDQLLFARPSTFRPVIVAPPPSDAVDIQIRESEDVVDGYEMLAQRLGGRGISVGRPVREWVRRIGRDFCDAWGRPLYGGRLSEPIDVPALLSLVAELVRERAGADVAVVNRGVLDRRWVPSRRDSLTASDIFVAIQYDEPLTVAQPDAAWMTSLVERLRQTDEGAVATPGLTYARTGTALGIRIGGHPLETRASYRVVTLRFLAAGGDGVLPPLPEGERWQDLGASLRATVLEPLVPASDDDPRERLENPDRSVQWLLSADADLSMTGSAIDNPLRRCQPGDPLEDGETCVVEPGETSGVVVDENGDPLNAFTSNPLTQSDTLTLGMELRFSADALAPDWTWDNDLLFLYRTTATEDDLAFAEAADLVRLNSQVALRFVRQELGEEWYVPDPTADLFIESEFTPPSDRGWRWFLTRPTGGARFQLVDRLRLRLFVGGQIQPFDPDREFEPGVGGSLELQRWELLRRGGSYAHLSFLLDYFAADLFAQNRQQLRGTLDAAYFLVGPFALAFQARLFVEAGRVNGRKQAPGASLTVTANLRLGAFARVR
ncbi:MAG: 5'-nucleotidase C-terminal domain-containing protein [Sandaracinaceae bacterium]